MFQALRKYLSPVATQTVGGWHPFVREPYAGAWQRNDEWAVDTVLAYPPVYACVTLIAGDISKLRVGVQSRSGNVWDYTGGDQVSTLLRRPNSYQNHIQFFSWWVISKLIRGNTYVLKRRDRAGQVTALYVLDPARVTCLTTETGDVYYQLNTDGLASVTEQTVTVPASEVIHDRTFPLFHPLIGISPLFACGPAGAQGQEIVRDSRSFWGQRATPGGVLTAPGPIKQETADRLKSHWESNYTGSNAGRVAVLGDGLRFEAMRMSASDSQLIDQLRWTAEAVCMAFKVPPYLVGLGASTSANLESDIKRYYSQCLQIHIEEMEVALADGLGLGISERVQFDRDDLFKMDSKTMMETLGLGVSEGLLAPNEGRSRINLPPLQGGDTVYMQQQNYSLAALDQRDQTNPLAAPEPEPVAPAPEPIAVEDDPEEVARYLAYSITKELGL